MNAYYFTQEIGEEDELLGFPGINEPELNGLEGVVSAIGANSLRLTSTGNGMGNMNGPCIVYVPVVNNGARHHKLDLGATQRLSHGWTKKELLPVLKGAPKTKVYADFDYNAFAEALAAQQAAAEKR